MTTFGAFAKILPVSTVSSTSQIADRRIEKPQDVLKVGDVVKVKITDIDFDKKRVSSPSVLCSKTRARTLEE